MPQHGMPQHGMPQHGKWIVFPFGRNRRTQDRGNTSYHFSLSGQLEQLLVRPLYREKNSMG